MTKQEYIGSRLIRYFSYSQLKSNWLIYLLILTNVCKGKCQIDLFITSQEHSLNSGLLFLCDILTSDNICIETMKKILLYHATLYMWKRVFIMRIGYPLPWGCGRQILEMMPCYSPCPQLVCTGSSKTHFLQNWKFTRKENTLDQTFTYSERSISVVCDVALPR